MTCALMSRSYATCATGLPAATRSRTFRRNSAGYRLGTSSSVSCSMSDHPATQLRKTRGTSRQGRRGGLAIGSVRNAVAAVLNRLHGTHTARGSRWLAWTRNVRRCAGWPQLTVRALRRWVVRVSDVPGYGYRYRRWVLDSLRYMVVQDLATSGDHIPELSVDVALVS